MAWCIDFKYFYCLSFSFFDKGGGSTGERDVIDGDNRNNGASYSKILLVALRSGAVAVQSMTDRT